MIFSHLLTELITLPQMGTCNAPIASPRIDSDTPLIVSGSYVARILDGNLYVSHDLGSSWFQPENIPKVDEFARDHTMCNFLHPSFSGKMGVLDRANDRLYVSNDQGYTFTSIELPKDNFSSKESWLFSISRQHPEWLILNTRGPSTWSVAITKDSGDTWQYFGEEWNHCDFIEGGRFVDGLIYCENSSMDIYEQFPTTFLYTCNTTDLSEPFKLIEGAPHYHMIEQFDDVLIAYSYGTNDVKISYDGIHFNDVKLPNDLSPNLKDSGLQIISDEGSLYLFMGYYSAKESNEGWCGMFILENSYELKLLLEDATGDFEHVRSDKGASVANVYFKYRDGESSKENYEVKTVITYDGGDHWGPLQGPDGKELHLQVDNFDWFFFLRHSEHGVFLANGNEGDYLSSEYLSGNDKDADFKDTHSYLTSDSGLTWHKVNEKPTYYVIGSSGNVIIEQPDWGSVIDRVNYSLDKGYTWQTYELGFKAHFYGIVSDIKGERFLFSFKLPHDISIDRSYRSEFGVTLTFENEQQHDQIRLI